MKPRTCLLPLMILPLVAYAVGEDHLVPENSPITFTDRELTDYDRTVGQVFAKALKYDQLRMIAMPSFQNEFGVALEQGDGQCEVFSLEAEHHLWLYRYGDDNETGVWSDLAEELAEYPENPLDVPVIVAKAPINPEICNRIRGVWEAALLETRYPQPPEGEYAITADGTSYRFATWVLGLGILSGQTHSPGPSTVPGKLVKLGRSMKRYAVNPGASSLNELTTALEELEETNE